MLNLVDTLHEGRYGLKFYAVPSCHRLRNFVTVLRTLYLMYMWMDLDDTLPAVRY